MLIGLSVMRITTWIGHRRRLPLPEVGILVMVVLVPVWDRLPGAPPPFAPDYPLGFLFILPVVWAIITWFLQGLPGFTALRHDNALALVVCGIGLLAIWSTLSGSWAFVHVDHPGAAAGRALAACLIALVAYVTASVRPSPRYMVAAFAIGLILHGMIGALQVVLQGAVGLHSFGEFDLDPLKSGISVVTDGDMRWLRPYGLSAHPNMLAGYLAAGTLAVGSWVLSSQRRRWLFALPVTALGLWVLLLTFSRSAWLGFGIVALAAAYRLRHVLLARRGRVVLVMLVGVLLGGAFALRFQDFLLVRAGVGEQQIETRSVQDRAIQAEAAFNAITQYPLRGVGAGNFPWYASHYFYYEKDIDRRGENVHNIYLTIQAELGVVGTLMFAATMGGGLLIGLRRLSRDAPERTLILLIPGAFLLIGVFDHYPWTSLHFQSLLWMTLLTGIPPIR